MSEDVSAPLRTVLAVDDEEGMRVAIRTLLSGRGYRVLEAADGRAAMEVLRDETVDLVILDVVMPRMNGWEVLSEIRQDARLKGIPVLMLTALEQPAHVATGIHLGATWYYVKPIASAAEFGEVVDRAIDA